MNSENQSQLIKQMIRKRGMTREQAASRMAITTMTLTKFINTPMEMRGEHRHALADSLGVQVEVIDKIINGRITYDLPTVETILEHVQPLKKTTKTTNHN